jgi:hypothetical protein
VGGACSPNGEKRHVFRLLVGKPEGKRPLGRPRRRWVNNVKTDLLEIGGGSIDWIDLTRDRQSHNGTYSPNIPLKNNIYSFVTMAY